MVSAKQIAANRANAFKSSGPRSEEGKFRAKLNSSKHGLSLPVDERVFADQIKAIPPLIREDCETDAQAAELAKRIIYFERNEEFLQNFNEKTLHYENKVWGFDPRTIALQQLAQAHRNKQKVTTTFTLTQKDFPVKLKGKVRTEEIKFLEGFLRLESNAILGRIRAEKNSQLSALRNQKRAINQLVKGVRMVARGEEF